LGRAKGLCCRDCLPWRGREREREREKIKKINLVWTVNRLKSLFAVHTRRKEKCYFSYSVGDKKWLVIVKSDYYEPFGYFARYALRNKEIKCKFYVSVSNPQAWSLAYLNNRNTVEPMDLEPCFLSNQMP
jgi:hypothetical protein